MRYLFVLLLVGGCMTPQEAARRQALADQAYTAGLQQRCAAYGITQQPALGQCMMQIDLQNRQNRAAQDAAATQNALRLLQQSGPTYMPAAPPPRDTSCVQRGNRIDCTTY